MNIKKSIENLIKQLIYAKISLTNSLNLKKILSFIIIIIIFLLKCDLIDTKYILMHGEILEGIWPLIEPHKQE